MSKLRYNLALALVGLLLLAVVLPAGAVTRTLTTLQIDGGNLKVGSQANNYGKFTVVAKTGITAWSLTPISTTQYPFQVSNTASRAAGSSGLYVTTTQNATALTGTLRGIYVISTNGTTAGASGSVTGAEIKARAADSSNSGNTIGTLRGVYVSVDAKNKTATTMRAFEASLDGNGSTTTEGAGIELFNNSSGTITNSYGVSLNGGSASGRQKWTKDIRLQQGETIDNNTDGTVQITAPITAIASTTGYADMTRSLSSQTTENYAGNISLTTDSTYLTGSDITYSGARGSSALKITGVYSGIDGGYSNIYSNITTSGAHTAAGAGVIGVKGVITNTAALTDGNIYGAQFIAKHNHATNNMANEAVLIGLEAWAYDSAAGTVGTLLGGNIGYHNESTGTKPSGSVHRALQVFCDDASGADAADEATGICIWNMAGTQTGAILIVKSGSGFGALLDFSAVGTCIVADTDAVPANSTHKILIRVGATTYYIPVHSTW